MLWRQHSTRPLAVPPALRQEKWGVGPMMRSPKRVQLRPLLCFTRTKSMRTHSSYIF
jgi:hypothetical protein